MYMAVNSGHRQLAETLVRAGADFNLSVRGKPIYPDLVQEKLPGFEPKTLGRKVAPLTTQLSMATFDRLVDIIHSSSRGGRASEADLAEFRSLLLQCDAETVNSRETGVFLLLQKTADLGLADLTEALLQEVGIL